MEQLFIEDFKKNNSVAYQKFIQDNNGIGNLKIRAYAASEALPVSGLKVVVSTIIDNQKVIFYEGVTDTSGMIPNISLPAPKFEVNSLVIPKTISYSITTDNQEFLVNMYDGICVVQVIPFIPGGSNGY